MADIFIAYASEDKERIKPIAEELKKIGWSVFWDHTIPTGETWQSYIKKAIDDSRCMLLVWSFTAVNLEKHFWLSEEAVAGRAKNILLPLKIDLVEPPFGYTTLQTVNLSNWKKNSSDPEFQKLVRDITLKIDSSETHPKEPDPVKVLPAWLIVLVATVAVFILIFFAPVAYKFLVNSSRDVTPPRVDALKPRETKLDTVKVVAVKVAEEKPAEKKLTKEPHARKEVIKEKIIVPPTNVGVPKTSEIPERQMKIGEDYGGGKIAFIDSTGNHGLIAARTDLPGGDGYTWDAAMNGCTNLKEDNYRDWHLPNKEELNKLYLNKSTIGGFASYNNGYWSSVEGSAAARAWSQHFSDGNQSRDSKTIERSVRAVRKF